MTTRTVLGRRLRRVLPLAALAMVAVALGAGCEGLIGSPGASGPSGPGNQDGPGGDDRNPEWQAPGCPPPPGLEETDRVMRGLGPHCAGCHTTGEKGYFASLDAFVSLLVANTRLVSPGDPEGSALVALLEGRGEGSAGQMPLSGAPYAEREDLAVPMAEIRSWIANLEPVEVSTVPDRSATTSARLSARMFRHAVPAVLGLSLEEITSVVQDFGVPVIRAPTRNFAALSPDAVPPPRERTHERVYFGLGGGSSARNIAEDRNPSATFVQYLVPLSHRWCELAVAKAESPLFTAASAQTTSEEPDRVRANLAAMQLRFWGEPATEAQLDRLVNDLFVPIETEAGPERAWVGVCAAFLRDPRFLFY